MATTKLPKVPHGLLSLLYWVKNSEDFNAAFHKNMTVTMRDHFGIPPDSYVAKQMLKISKDHSEPEKVRPLLIELCEKHLVNELMDEGRNFW